jgi:isovaleryl-CoA dehydrogenase
MVAAGVGILMTGLDLERATIASICLGIAERALQLSVEYAGAGDSSGDPSPTSR